MLKNLQEFAYRYVCCVPFDRRTIENFSLIYPQFLRLSPFSLFFFLCVFVCLYVYVLPHLRCFLAISRRYVDHSSLLAWFFHMFHFLIDVLSGESAPGHLLIPADPLPLYIPLISILRLAVFLSL